MEGASNDEHITDLYRSRGLYPRTWGNDCINTDIDEKFVFSLESSTNPRCLSKYSSRYLLTSVSNSRQPRQCKSAVTTIVEINRSEHKILLIWLFKRNAHFRTALFFLKEDPSNLARLHRILTPLVQLIINPRLLMCMLDSDICEGNSDKGTVIKIWIEYIYCHQIA